MEAGCLLTIVAFGDRANRFDDQDEADGCHEEAKGDVARGFYPCFAAGEATRVYALDCTVAEDEGEVADNKVSKNEIRIWSSIHTS